MVTKKTIDEFFSKKRIAVVGASRDKAKYGHHLFAELLRVGYDAVPVNPNTKELLGKKCFASLKDISPRPDAAIAVVNPSALVGVVEDAASAGVKSLWLHEHVMKGVSNPRAIAAAENNGIEPIIGFCPLMFMPQTRPFHMVHGFIMKMLGGYPKLIGSPNDFPDGSSGSPGDKPPLRWPEDVRSLNRRSPS